MRIPTALTASAFVATALAATALAASATAVPSNTLIWAAAPSFDDMSAAWPVKAGAQSEGTAVLSCLLARGGRLNNCDIVSEAPRFQGFGQAARSLTKQFRLKIDPAVSVDGRFVSVPFHFINPASANGQARKVSDPRWISMPDPNRVQGVFPKAAADAGVKNGVGVVDCQVARDGHLTDCRVAREDPVGVGFGEAAMLVAPIMQMNPWTDDGRPVDGARVKLPVRFGLAPQS